MIQEIQSCFEVKTEIELAFKIELEKEEWNAMKMKRNTEATSLKKTERRRENMWMKRDPLHQKTYYLKISIQLS